MPRECVGVSLGTCACVVFAVQVRVCEEDSLDGYRPAEDDGEAYCSTLRRRYAVGGFDVAC
jgi:hypothetical protein